MCYDFKKWWEHLKTHMVSRQGEAMTLGGLRAAAEYRLKGCDLEFLTVHFLQYQINSDLYRGLTAGTEARVPPRRQIRLPHEPEIEKGILLRLVADANVGLDALARAIETNGQEYKLGTQAPTTPVVAALGRPPGLDQAIPASPGKPPATLARTLVLHKRRLSAYHDLAAYVKHSLETGEAPDIADFLLVQQVEAADKMLTEATELGAAYHAILSSTVAPPVAPHGEYPEYSAEHENTREGEASRTGNETAGGD
ncbi:hypothetical protein DL768_004421 [Monosporascus sp. mg162]|nr:hypothetical protein DL768_004421 [Monosporascus sp. mg162]